MTELLLNPCGDIDFTDGQLTIVTQADLVRQRWAVYIRTFLGEWFLDTGIGIDYFGKVLVKGTTRDTLKQVFRDGTLAVPGVLQVTTVTINELNVEARSVELTVTCIIEGDETATFSYDGPLPGPCPNNGAELPAQFGNQWFWFDPSGDFELSFPEFPEPPALPNTRSFKLDNRFEQPGQLQRFGDYFYDTLPGSAVIASSYDEFYTLGSDLVWPVSEGVQSMWWEPGFFPMVAHLDLDTPADPNYGLPVQALRTEQGNNPEDWTVFVVLKRVPNLDFEDYAPVITFPGSHSPFAATRQMNLRTVIVATSELNVRVAVDTWVPGDGSPEQVVSATSSLDLLDFSIEPPFRPVVLTYRQSSATGKITMWVNTEKLFDSDSYTMTPAQISGEVSVGSTDDNFEPGYTDVLGGAWGDMIGYTTPRTDAEVSQLQLYLMAKWSVPNG